MSINVVSMRLANGDEIIGRLNENHSVHDGFFTLTKVRHVIVQQTREGLQTVLMPWAFSNVDGEVRITGAHVMGKIDPDPQSVAAYLQQTTSIALTS